MNLDSRSTVVRKGFVMERKHCVTSHGQLVALGTTDKEQETKMVVVQQFVWIAQGSVSDIHKLVNDPWVKSSEYISGWCQGPELLLVCSYSLPQKQLCCMLRASSVLPIPFECLKCSCASQDAIPALQPPGLKALRASAARSGALPRARLAEDGTHPKPPRNKSGGDRYIALTC